MRNRQLLALLASLHLCFQLSVEELTLGVEEDWGEGLKVVKTYQPASCEFRAQKNDVIHYHYVGRLDNGTEFGKSFDYDTPYIVALGQRRIIAGMDQGLVDMCLWERRKITIPPHLGYGSSGVGSIIPPHSTLVFYVRLIKIERDGVNLEGDASIEELWYRGLEAYGNSDWQVTINNLEEGIRVFDAYEEAALLCLKQCHKEGGPPKLSEEEMETVNKYAGADNRLMLQFLTYAAHARCVRECKAKSLSLNRRYPDPVVLHLFRKRQAYSYLHWAYYQLGNNEEGAKCFFTFIFHNPESDLVKANIDFYRKELGLKDDEYVWREPPTLPHQDLLLDGLKSYEEENYLEAVDRIESALPLYREALEKCQLLCEDVLIMNITDREMSDGMREILNHYAQSLEPDVLDYHSVLGVAIRELLECRVRCHDDMARVKGMVLEDYLANHFHHLQYSYYKLGLLLKAAECAATYLGMAPSDEVMLSNVRYYISQYRLQSEDFVPREEYVAITEKLATEKRLLHFATHGEPMKKQGQRGDHEEHRPSMHHEEL